MSTTLAFSTVKLAFPRWRMLLDQARQESLSLARRLILMRLIWEEGFTGPQALLTRVEDFLGPGCFGAQPDATLAEDLEAVRQALSEAGHQLIYCPAENPLNPTGRSGYWIVGRPPLDEKIVQQIRGAIGEIDVEQMRLLRQLTPAERFQRAAHLSDEMQAMAIYRLRQQQTDISLEDAVRQIRERRDYLDGLRL